LGGLMHRFKEIFFLPSAEGFATEARKHRKGFARRLRGWRRKATLYFVTDFFGKFLGMMQHIQ